MMLTSSHQRSIPNSCRIVAHSDKERRPAANVKLEVVTIDTDTTVHTLYGQQMGGRKSYNPKNKGKNSYMPMLTFIAETREYVWGELRNGDRPTGKQIGDHLHNVHAALPRGVKHVFGRADSGFYCREAVEAYEEFEAQFAICARKKARLVEQLRRAEWKPSRKTDAGWECEFRYQPDGWSKPYRFVALRYENTREGVEAEETEQYQLFETSQYKYRVFVTNMSELIDFAVWFYGQRGGAENPIKEANNDAGLAVLDKSEMRKDWPVKYHQKLHRIDCTASDGMRLVAAAGVAPDTFYDLNITCEVAGRRPKVHPGAWNCGGK